MTCRCFVDYKIMYIRHLHVHLHVKGHATPLHMFRQMKIFATIRVVNTMTERVSNQMYLDSL